MHDMDNEQGRRDFIKLSSLGVFGLHPVVSTISKAMNLADGEPGDWFEDEFHYFGNNLTNLHFYFINAKINGQLLKPTKDEAFMVVKIPQQHISEQLIRVDDFDTSYSENTKRTTSKISGFSFLAFRLFPMPKKPLSAAEKEAFIAKKKNFIDLSKMQNLLDWDNPLYFELLIPSASDYKKFEGNDVLWQYFSAGTTTSIKDTNNQPKEGYIVALYKTICSTLFTKDTFPLTILEIPEGMISTPYNKDNNRVYMMSNKIKKDRYSYSGTKGQVYRTVEEICSAQMFMESAAGLTSPPLRGAGYIPRDESLVAVNRLEKCPPPAAIKYLPTLLDKAEIVFLTSLGRGDNREKEWDIETKGLVLTGLGAITKMHYKNFNPPNGSTLAEYEHHITLGRDEYIKVARIGVISATGQKALFVQIGERKIKNGTSYMEFKEYIEIIQKEIVYFDNRLFIGPELGSATLEPQNYIQARQYPYRYNKPGDIIHSKDKKESEDDNTYRDSYLWNLKLDGLAEGYLPNHPYKGENIRQNWHTHYRRWPFKKIKSVTVVSKPIITDIKINPTALTYMHVGCTCGEVFWPVLEARINNKEQDCYMDFIGYDWNDKEIRFSSTFLFIRKDLIECTINLPQLFDEIYTKRFINQPFGRRHISFLNTEIALCADYIPLDKSEDALENKSNVAKVDYLEYYFSICSEPVRETFETNTVIPDTAGLPFSSVFNERLFPLYPQVKRVQLYIDNIQSYVPEPLASIIEYNDDFINYGYTGKKDVLINNKIEETIYNKARLIFNHTERFIKDSDKIITQEGGKLIELQEAGYKRIKQAFSNAGNSIGGLVNPDFDIPCIGLIKQSISVGKEINKKYETITKKIDSFNPSDLLRQAPEIFNGISFIDILLAVFPEFEGPVNDIKNLAAKLDETKNDLINNPIYKSIRADMDFVNDTIKKYVQSIEKFEADLTVLREKIRDAKNRFNGEYLAAEIEKLANSAVERYKIKFLDYRKEMADLANTAITDVSQYLATELMSKAEVIYPYYAKLNEARKILTDIKKVSPGLTEVTKIIDQYQKDFLGASLYVLINLDAASKDKILNTYADVKSMLEAKASPYFNAYKDYTTKLDSELKALAAYTSTRAQKDYTNYLAAKTITLKAWAGYSGLLETADKTKGKAGLLLYNLRQVKGEYDKIVTYEKALGEIQETVVGLSELFETFNIPYYINTYNKSVENIKVFYAKLQSTKLGDTVISQISTLLTNNSVFIKKIQDERAALQSFYRVNYDVLKNDFNTLVFTSKGTLTRYIEETTEKRIKEVFNLSAFQKPFTDLKKDIEDKEEELKNMLRDFMKQVKDYENFLKNKVNAAKDDIIGLVKKKIKEKEDELLADPDNQLLINTVIKGRELYNLLSTFSSKEVNYNWQTSSFKNAEFGIVSFIASSNPKTSLTVSVKNTIYFQLNKFPAVIDRIESKAENRLSNFGISLLKAIIINFNEVSFVAGTNQRPKFEVKIRDVQFAGAFSFVQALESIFKDLLGDNFTVKIQPLSVEIQYLLPIPYIGAPSFGFKDILFKIVYTLNFDKKPMELGVGIGAPENRTKLSVGIYTGLFYFIVIGDPKNGITTIEISIEFGGYFGLNLGPLRGEVKLVVGLYYRKDPTGVIIEGYFLCEGNVKLWFAMIAARFYMGVRSRGNYIEGRCTVTYEISLGRFFKKSFSATYYKKVAGASPGNGQGRALQNNINQYNALSLLADVSTAEGTYGQTTRKVKPLTVSEWEIFINSYVD